MYIGCTCFIFAVIFGTLISQEISAKETIKQNIQLNSFLHKQSNAVFIQATIENYTLIINFNKIVEGIVVYIKSGESIIISQETSIAYGQRMKIDLSSLSDGEYQLLIYDFSNECVWGHFVIDEYYL